MKRILLLSVLLASGAQAADDAVEPMGRQLLEDHCMACHTVDGMGGGERPAPPMYAVWHHYRQAHDNEQDFTRAIAGWVHNPTDKSAEMKGAVKKFGLMDKVDISEEDAQRIAEYLYSRPFELPESYLTHYREKHGTKAHGYD